MSNGKDIRKAQKAIKAGKPVIDPYKYDIDYMSKMGYRDDSPYNQNPYNDIYTPNGMIDMSQTGIPLYANGQYLPPYSGMHDLGTPNVREVPANQFPIAQYGGGYIPVGYYPSYNNSDGSYSNEVSRGMNIDGQEMLLPSFWEGSTHTDDETEARYKKTGEHLGAFKNVADAERAAQLREFMNNEVHPYVKKYGGWLDEYGDGAEKRKIPQSGIVVDKRTNIGYAMGDDGKTRTFNVLTGQVVDVNKDYSYDQVAKNPKLRGTPVGYYLLQKELTKIKGDDDDKHYKNKIRYLKPISAFGEKVNSSSDLAFHRLYSDNAYNPNDKEFNRRKALLNQSDANKRCASWGCTNVDDYTYDNVNKMFSKQDTLLVIDSKRPKDLALLNQTKKRMKASLDQDPSLAVGYKKMGGWLDDYQVGAETLEDNDDILPSWDKVKATLNPMNWGVTDYTKSGTRAQAFNAARKAGEKEFMWNNERFNTDYAGTPEQQLKETGITNERLQNRSLLQKRFFNNVYPRGYESDEYGNPDIIKTIKRVGNAVILNKKDPRMASLDIKDNPRVDASRMYTGLPQQNNTFNISKYKPTNSKDNIFYYSINNKKFENDLIDNIDQISTLSDYKKYFTKDEIKILKEGKDQGAINKLRKKLLDADDYNLHNNYITQNLNKTFGLNIRNDLDVMGNFKVDKGTDDRGNYISYFDKWDLAPLEEKKQLLGIKAKYENKANTDYFGKPFEIYDRIYIKDYGKGNTKMYYSDKELSALDSNKKDFDTQALQTELSNRGYKFPTSTKKDGRFDGIYGDETKKALQDYQSKNVKSKLKYGGWLDDLDTYQTAGQVNNRQDNTRVVIPNLPKDVFNEKNSFKKDWLSDAYEEDENVKLLKKQLAKNYQKNGLSKDQAKLLAEDAYRNVKHNKSLKETIPESTFEQHVPQDLTSKTLEVLANPLLAMKQYKGHRLPDHFSSADEDFMSPVNISNLGYQFLTRPGQLAFSSQLGNEAIDNIKEGEYLEAGLNTAFALPGVKVIKDAIKYKNKLGRVANIKNIKNNKKILPDSERGKIEGLGYKNDIEQLNIKPTYENNPYTFRDPYTNETIYQTDPADFENFVDAKEYYKKASNQWLNNEGLKRSGSTDVPQFNQEVKDLSTQMQFGKRPIPTQEQFYTTKELNKLKKQHNDYYSALNEYEKANPQNGSDMMMGIFSGNNSYMNTFHNLNPNLVNPNFGEKFIANQEYSKMLNKNFPYSPGVKNSLSPSSLKFIGSNENKLLPNAKNLVNRADDWFHKANKKDYLIEMRGSAGLKIDDIKNMSAADIEMNAQKIYDKIGKQQVDMYLKDVSTPYTGTQAFKDIQPNKYGGDLQQAQLGRFIKAGLAKTISKPAVKILKNNIIKPISQVLKDPINYKNKLNRVANIKEIRKVSNYLNKEGALENQGINELDQQYANRLELENDIPPPPTYEQYAEAQIDPLSRQDYILRNLQRIDPDPFNAMNSIGLREPNYELYNDLYDQSYSSAPVNRLPDIWTNYRKRQSLTQDLMNRSGVTKEQALERFNLKDKDLLSKMSAKDFKETVVKPTGDLAEYIPGPSIKQMTYKSELGDKQLKDAILMSKEEYSTAFNDRLDLLNNIIKKNNKTGIEYRVKELDPAGNLRFETPEQFIASSKPVPEHYLEALNKINEPDFLYKGYNNKLYFSNMSGAPGFTTKEEAKNWITDVVEKARGNRIPKHESTWHTDINPGNWRGEVEDIANTEYYKSIPGLNMRNTSSLFGYGTPKRGSGTYASINEYLKALDLGRVKAGFNSQTDNSFGLWNNAVKKGNAFGFYRTPDLVHGVMKSALPYIGTGALGAAALDQVSESSDIPQDRLGGQRRLKKATSKNIQSSINDLMLRSDLMQRNQTLFGPAGKRRYKPGLKYKEGGWLDQFDK